MARARKGKNRKTPKPRAADRARRRVSSSSGEDSMPPLQAQNGNNSSDDDDDSDIDAAALSPPTSGSAGRSSRNSDDDDSDNPPPLVDRNDAKSSSESDSDDDERRRMPQVIAKNAVMINNKNRNKNTNGNDHDNFSDSDSDEGPPPLISRDDHNSSSSDEDSNKKEKQQQQQQQQQPPVVPSEKAKRRNIKKRENAKRKKQAEREKKEKAEREHRQEQVSSRRISAFFRHVRARKRSAELHSRCARLQALVRGSQFRAAGTGRTTRRHLDQFLQFYGLWGNCVKFVAQSVESPYSWAYSSSSRSSLPSSPVLEMDIPDWSALRDKQAFIRQQELMMEEDGGDVHARKETDKVLTSSMEDAMRVMEEKAENERDDNMEDVFLPQHNSNNSSDHNNNNNNNQQQINFKRIHLSGEVVKWLRNGDPRYVDFFVRRMKQLSGGERSRILAKRLTGSTTKKVPIYETYLEQKSGFRILWTEEDDYLLVWYIAKHHRVSRLMRLIDDSKNRSERQRISIDDIDEMKTADGGINGANNNNNNNTTTGEDKIFLDPLGNVPLKVYDIGADEIENIKKKDWTPALHLTEEEREVVETEGTVLLLGRSGTGKTVCICNRMEYDRQQRQMQVQRQKSQPQRQKSQRQNEKMADGQQQQQQDPSSCVLFSQLFVARSPRLCTYVKKNIGGGIDNNNNSDGFRSEFVTFDMLLVKLEQTLPKVEGIRDSFPEELMMKFSVFKREVYSGSSNSNSNTTAGSSNVDPLIVWTNIRSFIKGSIEALQSGSSSGNTGSGLTGRSNDYDFFVLQEEYLSEENFGKKRCRLSTELRKSVYDIFVKYQETLAETNAWDTCDRIVALIQRLLAAKSSHPELFEELKTSWAKWSKIYVDEVQDYTQVEILLFFHLSGPGNLFLAGDPAQNVTKGVEFRFDEIRSVGYHIAGEDRRLIPQKPKIVNVNFRSHAGILNAAASILSQMFAYFPDSAKQLGKDDGLFRGPRPGIFHKAKPETMADLMREKMKGTVVLTHDEHVNEVIQKLGGYELVYGIRRAKGLEFKSVIVMDFFSVLPSDLQKPWRELLLNRANVHEFKSKYPEVEGHLKLLYTAVTRCIDRLFFAETAGSVAGDAFLRFMTNTESVKRSTNNISTLSIATRNKIGDIENMTMTQDEWLASGITNAEAADAEITSDNEHARSLIEKAIYCFQQADNELFAKKAKIQLASFQIRHNIFDAGGFGGKQPSLDSNRISSIEKEAAKLSEKLLKENLLLEAKGLGRDVQKILQKSSPSSVFLERDVLRHLG